MFSALFRTFFMGILFPHLLFCTILCNIVTEIFYSYTRCRNVNNRSLSPVYTLLKNLDLAYLAIKNYLSIAIHNKINDNYLYAV
jgi:hypothetical protein